MTTTTAAARAFGTNLVAVPTPMNPDFTIDEPGFASMTSHLVSTRCDGIVVSGTTGESPTLSENELARLVAVAKYTAGDGAKVIAGVGTNDTLASVRRAQIAADAGADALLVVVPYYSRPTQAGIVTHCTTIADATDLPVMVYDVPHRTGMAFTPDSLIELAQHRRILAVKDAKGDLAEAMAVMTQSDLEYYCGNDGLNLPYLAAGATGIVSVVGAVRAADNAALLDAVAAHDLVNAREINRSLIGAAAALNGVAPAPVTTKVALRAAGVIEHVVVRPPLAPVTEDEVAQVVAATRSEVSA
ncbi:4-hydroxy-tetrahydrodipicolinate synthase [Gordonia zhaorongruii]|uniref:4-hydroxy-tetrahydrodipicolinate synthase n=1 Tax=Gordonia zhaorongruii TaxID=2597659 RepID=UPI001049FF84|nr:4-hydroxy-tetrahydrodipicolinate synthase [Gordonia zhaorongruii]